MYVLILLSVAVALFAAMYNYFKVKRKDPGTKEMQAISDEIRIGANAFLTKEFKIIAVVVVVVSAIFWVVVAWYVAVAFIIGALMSSLAGICGMKMATLANVRVSNEARTTKDLGKTLKVAFQGGSVMGLCVGGFALLGLTIVFIVFGVLMGQMDPEALTVQNNWLSISFIPFAMTVLGYALGCSLIAMFNRVGGGIYTKAADMGADLVGKTEAHIPEDDPRNPATIADNVGDNVGDVAGLGSDLLESFIGAIVACVALACYTFYLEGKEVISPQLVTDLITYPVIFAAIGLLACVIGIMYLVLKKTTGKPHKELNISTWASAGLTVVGTGIFTYFYFGKFSAEQLMNAGYRAGALSPWIAAVLGIVSGIAIGAVAEYYTSYDYKPTRRIARASVEGAALTITDGLGVGMKSTLIPVMILAAAAICASQIAGIYGVTMAAIGMLSFVAATVSVDTYGPISDNAGGISEMAKLEPEVRKITDKLDSVGNTTAAVGKGFAIGSAALAALSLLVSYLHSQASNIANADLILNVIDPLTLAGLLVGGTLPFFFSGILIDAVSNAARNMVDEVRRQFREMPGILTGKQKPDCKRCIEISSAGAIKEMKKPAFIAILFPLVGGFIFGASFVGGMLIGTTLSGIMLALFTANSGGAWDNAKKYIESGHIEGCGKGSDTHSAAVIGDTVGDPLKDTVGPSLDILIKIMATVSVIGVSIFGKFNLFSLWF